MMVNCNAVGWGAIINRTDNSCLSADNLANNNHDDEIDNDGENDDDGNIIDDDYDDDDDDGGGSIPCSWWSRQLIKDPVWPTWWLQLKRMMMKMAMIITIMTIIIRKKQVRSLVCLKPG